MAIVPNDPIVPAPRKLPLGLGLYSFRYLWERDDSPPHLGLMADEIGLVVPDALGPVVRGFQSVDYGGLLAALLKVDRTGKAQEATERIRAALLPHATEQEAETLVQVWGGPLLLADAVGVSPVALADAMRQTGFPWTQALFWAMQRAA